MERTPGFEHNALRGITIKNMIVTVVSTASIVIAVMTTYTNLKSDIRDIKNQQDTEAKINNIRLKMLEDRMDVLQQEINNIKGIAASSSPGHQ